MQFLKKNYEKVLLGLVLFGLVVAVGFLPFLVGKEKAAQEERTAVRFNFPVQPLPPVDTNQLDYVLAEAALPLHLDLTTTNRLFNPVRWLYGPNGPIKVPPGDELQKLLQITKITPLYLIVTLDSVNLLESGARYGISIEDQGAAQANRRGKRVYYASLNEKREPFVIREVKGQQPDDPTSVTLELTDTGERISISKEKGFKRVDGYLADLKCPAEGRSYPNQRVGNRIVVSGEQYNIVAINENEVVLSAPNGKKYTIRYNAGP
jgi:hypothetical protein